MDNFDTGGWCLHHESQVSLGFGNTLVEIRKKIILSVKC